MNVPLPVIGVNVSAAELTFLRDGRARLFGKKIATRLFTPKMPIMKVVDLAQTAYDIWQYTRPGTPGEVLPRDPNNADDMAISVPAGWRQTFNNIADKGTPINAGRNWYANSPLPFPGAHDYSTVYGSTETDIINRGKGVATTPADIVGTLAPTNVTFQRYQRYSDDFGDLGTYEVENIWRETGTGVPSWANPPRTSPGTAPEVVSFIAPGRSAPKPRWRDIPGQPRHPLTEYGPSPERPQHDYVPGRHRVPRTRRRITQPGRYRIPGTLRPPPMRDDDIPLDLTVPPTVEIVANPTEPYVGLADPPTGLSRGRNRERNRERQRQRQRERQRARETVTQPSTQSGYRSPPDVGVRERKARVKFAGVVGLAIAAVEQVPEFLDTINALWKALPRSCQSGYFKLHGKGGKTFYKRRFRASQAQRINDVRKCWSHMDLQKALEAVVAMNFEDKAYGKLGQWAAIGGNKANMNKGLMFGSWDTFVNEMLEAQGQETVSPLPQFSRMVNEVTRDYIPAVLNWAWKP